MSDYSLILALHNKRSKIINDIATISIESEKATLSLPVEGQGQRSVYG